MKPYSYYRLLYHMWCIKYDKQIERFVRGFIQGCFIGSVAVAVIILRKTFEG